MTKKIEAGEENPVVSRVDAWEYARRNADGVCNDPATLQILEDAVLYLFFHFTNFSMIFTRLHHVTMLRVFICYQITISQNLPEHELTHISMDDLLARLIPLEYSGRVRGVGWGVTKTSLQTGSTMSKLARLEKNVSYLINEIKELKSKGHNPGVQSGGSSQMDNFDMDNEVLDEQNDHDQVLGEDLPQVHVNVLKIVEQVQAYL